MKWRAELDIPFASICQSLTLCTRAIMFPACAEMHSTLKQLEVHVSEPDDGPADGHATADAPDATDAATDAANAADGSDA